MFGPIVNQVQSEFPQINISKVDVDAAVNQQVVSTYRINAVPALVFVKDGVELYRKSGVMTKQELTTTIQRYD
jgi:thioredoxin 1